MLLRAGKTNLPAPTSMTVNDEIIWSEDTGADAERNDDRRGDCRKENGRSEMGMADGR